MDDRNLSGLDRMSLAVLAFSLLVMLAMVLNAFH